MPRESESPSESASSVAGIPDRIPIFPLPSVVFFPRTYLPLHIFEPRYRRMIADAAATHQCIGMALLKDGWEEDYAGNPPIFSVGCVGRLISLEPLPDGRSNILLQGVERFSVEEEFADRPYREARVRWRPTEPCAALSEAVREDLARWLEAYVRSREDGHRWRNLSAVGVHDEILINGLATYLAWTPVEKQLLLEADGLEQRARRLIDLLWFALDDDRRPAGWN